MVYKTYSYPGVYGTAESNTGQIISATGYGSTGNQDTAVNTPWRDNTWNKYEITMRNPNTWGEYRNSSGNLLWTLKGYPIGAGNFNQAVSSPTPQWNIVTPLQAVARSHPGQPAIDVPNFLYELKDVPGMLRHAWNRARELEKRARSRKRSDILRFLNSDKSRAQDWLNYKFGWAPLLGDLMDFMDLSKAANRIQKRNREASESRRGYSRVMEGGLTRKHGSNSTSYFSPAGHQARRTTEWVINSNVYSRWRFDPNYFKAFDSDYSESMRAALGLDFSVTQAWNAAPWTWLTDWFIDVGSVVETYSNRFGWTFANAQTMHHTQSETRIVPNVWTGKAAPSHETLYIKTDAKTRSHYTPTVSLGKVFTNFFTADQLATLASLKVAKSR